MHSLTMDLPDNIYIRLGEFAKKTKKNKKSLIKEAILEYLEDREDYFECLKRVNKGGKTFTLEELEKKYGLED